jgi:hypothetical protein
MNKGCPKTNQDQILPVAGGYFKEGNKRRDIGETGNLKKNQHFGTSQEKKNT